MYQILQHAHSGLRWLVLIALIAAIINAFNKKSKISHIDKSDVSFTSKDKMFGLFALIFTHIQLILGLVLYFISPLVQFSSGTMKNSVLRFYTVEHITLMVIAIVIITVGYSKAKRIEEDAKKFKTIGVYYLIGLILILISIPWPFRNLGAGWF